MPPGRHSRAERAGERDEAFGLRRRLYDSIPGRSVVIDSAPAHPPTETGYDDLLRAWTRSPHSALAGFPAPSVTYRSVRKHGSRASQSASHAESLVWAARDNTPESVDAPALDRR
jgi:hypothetical protein